MAKSNYLRGIVFFLLFNLSVTLGIACLENTYLSQVGIRELTGKNDGKQIEAYQKVTKAPKHSPYCASFVAWCFVQCEVKTVQSAWSPSWFPQNKVIYKQGKGIIPQSGDVFGLYYPSKKRVAHVGFIHKWGDVYIITVEANTNDAGSREGDGVYKKRRLKRQIYIVSRWL